MTSPGSALIVIGRTEAFSRLWPELAKRHGLFLDRLDAPEPIGSRGFAAAVLVCAGRETHALELLHEAQRAGIDAPLVVGAEADHRLAVELMRRGAACYFALPEDAERLETEIAARSERPRSGESAGDERAPAGEGATGGDATGAGEGAGESGDAMGAGEGADDGYAGEREGPARLAEIQSAAHDFSTIVGNDGALKDALERASRVIPRESATILITGETGTGKELLAQAIHYNGPRARDPFVTVNCAAIPLTLLESELFGHEKGAFTDARTSKPGLFQVADGGTLFLDEIATLPLELQGKLLRVLESGEVRRLGGVRTTVVDVRIIAAANVDLAAAVRDGAFRDDLYYRLAVVPIHLPPLRERTGDVPVLARHFLDEIAEEYGLSVPELSEGALRELERHSWPGNVRELRNALERALLLTSDGTIEPRELALGETTAVSSGEEPARVTAEDRPLPFPATLEELEIAATLAMLERCDGNKSEAARRLDITRSRLYRILERAEETG